MSINSPNMSGLLGSNSGSGSGSGDFWSQLATNPNSLLGPDYKYTEYVKTPNEMGVGPGWNSFYNDVAGLVSYVEILVAGTGKASATGQPLGNKFFMKTAAKCKAADTKSQVDRYIYVNNVPTGNIPFVSAGTGVNFKTFRGLIPGVLTNVNSLNPIGILNAFTTTDDSVCSMITMQTIGSKNEVSTDSHYVMNSDIKEMDPCIFPNLSNPISGKNCRNAFTNLLDSEMIGQNDSEPIAKLPQDPVVQLYFLSLGLLSIYLMYRISGKTK